jgi:hypothetical protein
LHVESMIADKNCEGYCQVAERRIDRTPQVELPSFIGRTSPASLFEMLSNA